VSRTELVERANRGEVVVLDVRPHDEFAAGHVPGALSLPLDQLDSALAQLPKRAQIVACCRGPYCVLAPKPSSGLRAKGFKARRLAEGMPERRLAGLPVAVGEE
jgi:ArsR family transcriptional regulator